MTRTIRELAGHLAPVLLFGVGCSALGAGGCEHTYRDPIPVIASAADAASGSRIGVLFLTEITVGDQGVSPANLLAPSFGARIVGDTLVCTVSCGFGTSEGRYTFRATAAGYVAKEVTTEARYSRFEGGCPSYNAGGSRTHVVLTRLG